MAPTKYNGGGAESLLPERRGGGGGSSIIFAGVVRRRKLSRFIFSKRTAVWIWMSFLLFALFFVSFSVFGLKFQLPGNFERFERLNNGRGSGSGGGDRMSETAQVGSGSVNVNVNVTVFVPPPNEVKKQGFIGSYTNTGVAINPPKSKSKRHHPCEVNFTESVNYLIEPQDVRNFTQFSLHYVTAEEKPSDANLFKFGFGGHQTLAEREKSFYATDQTLHCGFVKGTSGFPSTGFELDEKDRAYMSTCQVVVSSCIFGSSDFLRRPTSRKISEFSKQNVCFVMFVDEKTQSKLASDGHVPDDRGQVGLWKIVVVRNLPYEDMRRTGKVPKFLSHRLFPSARYSIWLDSKMRLNTDPMMILEYFLWRTKSEYAISNHYDRHCVWDEVLQNKRLNKYNHTAIDEQFNFYRSDGLTKFDSSNPNTLLPSYVPEGSFIVRAHTPMSNLFSCLWFNEVNRFTSRDQLSFAYTYLKLRRLNPDRPFYINMFKDCERRALAKLFRHRTLPSTPTRP